MTLSRFFWSNSRGPGGLTDSREKGLGFPNRYQYVPPAQTTTHTKTTKSHIAETLKSTCFCFRVHSSSDSFCFSSPLLVRLLLRTNEGQRSGDGGNEDKVVKDPAHKLQWWRAVYHTDFWTLIWCTTRKNILKIRFFLKCEKMHYSIYFTLRNKSAC